MESKLIGNEVDLASASVGTLFRLRGTAVQPNSSIWDFDMLLFDAWFRLGGYRAIYAIAGFESSVRCVSDDLELV